MSRNYLLEVDFDKSHDVEKIKKFFNWWCGKDQIFRLTKDFVLCEMGCSGGVAPEDTMFSLHEQLIEKGFKVNKEDIFCWSLHPDEATYIDHDEEVCSKCGREF